jgi:hypothetical protein
MVMSDKKLFRVRVPQMNLQSAINIANCPKLTITKTENFINAQQVVQLTYSFTILLYLLQGHLAAELRSCLSVKEGQSHTPFLRLSTSVGNATLKSGVVGRIVEK